MNTNSFIGLVATVAAATLSTACVAGGRSGGGPVLRIHMGMAGTHLARFGHPNSAFLGRRNAVASDRLHRPFFDGFSEFRRLTLVGRGFEPDRRFPSYAFSPHGRYRSGSVLSGAIGAGGYGYGDDLGSAPSPMTGAEYGYADPPLTETYAEAPLEQRLYFGDDGGPLEDRNRDFAPSAGAIGGGPRVIAVHADDPPRRSEACSCASGYSPTPIVYRFGVGSYY